MKTIIMAGGFGTRLRPLTCNIPKPMVPMVNRPMMMHIVDLLKKHGINDIISLLYYHPAAIRNFFGEGKDFDITMQYMQAEADFGTAGSVRNAKEKIGDERILIISGDVLTDFDLDAALRFHEEKNADATLVLTRVPNPLQFGVVIVDDDGNITRFLEKPSWGEVFSDTINTGIYIIENHVLDMIPYKEDYDFSKDLFPAMMSEDMKLCGYIADGYWRDVGTLNEYHEASMDCLAGKVDIIIEGNREDNVYVGTESYTPSDRSHWSGTVVIGRNSRVADSANIINSVIGDNVTVHDGAEILNSVVWDGCVIEDSVHVSNSVIGLGTVLGAGSTISDNVFISDKCSIGSEATLLSNIKLWPEKIVEAGAILSKSLVWEDKWLKELFTDARITGTANIEVNPEFAAKLGSAMGAILGHGSSVIASRDPDNASRMIKRSIVCGLMSAGVAVHDLQTTPIPMVRQVLRSGKNAGGFHVRKSPFDKKFMDIIFFDGDGKDLASKSTKGIERQFFSEDYKRADFNAIGSINFPERITETYRDRFFSKLDFEAISSGDFSVVLDYSYGLASSVLPNILGKIGAEIITLNAYIDPSRLTRTKDEFDSACKHISNIVKSLSCDLGILLDPGVEKTFTADEQGLFIEPDRLLTIVTKLFLESSKKQGKPVKKIACPVVATSEVEAVASEYGVSVIRTTNTHGGMMNSVIDDPDIAFVGGTRGGYIFPEFLFATDAMYSIAKILEMMAITGWKLGELNKKLPRLFRKQVVVPCPWKAKGTVMRHAMHASEQQERVLIDGIKILFDRDNWVLLLPSKETETFTVYAEADSEQRVEQLADEYREKVVQWRDNA